ncbi:MAG TPA: hypothetical protein VIQ05_00975 [Tardiphaga sp.]
MPAIQTRSTVPHVDPASLPFVSDDECLIRLAAAVQSHDSDRLDELALLIGRLAVPIE